VDGARPRQDARSHRALPAPKNAHGAVAALVAVGLAGMEAMGEQISGDTPARGGGNGFRIQFQTIHLQPPHLIRPVQGEQARLGGDEGEGVAGPDSGAPQHTPVAVQARGAVQGQEGAGVLLRQSVGALNQAGMVPFYGPAQADAEQAIHNRPPVLALGNGA